MDSLLTRLERRFGRFAIEGLTAFVVGGMAIVFCLGLMKPTFVDQLTLDIAAVQRGQVWRLFTYLFVYRASPGPLMVVWFAFALYMLWMVGSSLESEWGAFKLNVYYVLGMVGTTVAALLTHQSVGNTYLNTSLFLAFATVFPDIEIIVFFVLPVRVRWLGMIAAAFLVYEASQGTWPVRGAIVAAMANYILFFFDRLLRRVRKQPPRVARKSVRPPPAVVSSDAVSAGPTAAMGARVCAICGAAEVDGADIRVCTCEKCGGKPRNLCLPHARNH